MEENKNEEVVEQITEQPKVDDTVEKIKVKKKPTMKKLSQDDEVIKVDLNTPPTPKEDEKTKEDVTDDGGVVEFTEDANATQEQEEVQSEIETQETPVLEEVTEEKVEELTEQVEEAVAEAKATGKELPENITKLMEFMEDTGGDLEDYIKLNQDYAKLDNHTLLKEYYKQTKTHLEDEEIDFLMEDQFSYDEDIDDEKDIKRKKLALKEQVANARTQLEESKSKYYEDIKAGSKLTGEQQKAVDFFNRYNKESEGTKKTVKKNTEIFEQKTNNLFNDKFKGFEYNVGEKKFRFNVKDVGGVKESQSDLNNFMSKFVNKDLSLNDAEGYHRSLFTAMNADKIANHFYEQGKADALKNSVAKSKNISMDPRQQHSGEINAGGIKVRVLGENSNDFKFKIKNK
tara:strand:+ start:679 stop:1881 length:1203 start_codon:yes stop_codon:yes gene_type:complete